MIAVILSFAVRGMGALGSVLLSLIIARMYGPEALGHFAVFLSLSGVLSILSLRGMDMLLIRSVAWADHRMNSEVSVSLLRSCIKKIAIPSLLLSALGSAMLASTLLGVPYLEGAALLPLILPLQTGLALVSGYAKGKSRAWLAPMFETGGISLVAALFLSIFFVRTGDTSGGVSLMLVFSAAMVLMVIAAVVMLLHDIPRPRRLPVPTDLQRSELRNGQVDFTVIALAVFITQAGSFLLAAPFLTEADLGLLRAVERLALLVSFPVLAINPVIAPRIAKLSRGGDAVGLRRLVLRAILATGGIAACALMPLLVWPERALALMGAEFAAAAPYLRVMALAQFLAALAGPLMVLLNMSGRERASMWINVGTLALAVALFPALSLAYGAYGFAGAYAAIIALRTTSASILAINNRKQAWGQK